MGVHPTSNTTSNTTDCSNCSNRNNTKKHKKEKMSFVFSLLRNRNCGVVAVFVLVLSLLSTHVSGVDVNVDVDSDTTAPSSSSSCIKELNEIYAAEQALVENDGASPERLYVLCSDTTFYPGRVSVVTINDGTNANANNQQGQIEDDSDTPLVCRSNCRIECEDSNCIIDGSRGGSYGILFMPAQLAFNSVIDNDNTVVQSTTIHLEGITVRNWMDTSNQIPVAIGGSTPGSITFSNCIFEHNKADPLFLIDEFYYEDERRNLQEGQEQEQENTKLEIIFSECQFRHNRPSIDAQTQGGLSLVRFRATDPYNPVDRLLTKDSILHASFLRCDFTNNTYYFQQSNDNDNDNDEEESLALIDFYSTGTLVLEDNCFDTSPTQKHGVITVQDGATLINTNNYYASTSETDEDRARRDCDFLAIVDSQYEQRLNNCTAPTALAQATSCRPEPAAPPFAICFPGDTTVETLNGMHIPLQQLNLGDQIRVPSSSSTPVYETVYSFGHRHETMKATFLQIQIISENKNQQTRKLEISPQHMLYLLTQNNNGNNDSYEFLPASMVQVGDYLQLSTTTNIKMKVQSIRTIQKSKGVYAPFTTSGTLLVNRGIVVSSFIAFQNNSNTGIMTHQSVAHAFEFFHRLYCSLSDENCRFEAYTSDGISTWVALPYQFVITTQQWFHNNGQKVFYILNMMMMIVATTIALFSFYPKKMTAAFQKQKLL